MSAVFFCDHAVGIRILPDIFLSDLKGMVRRSVIDDQDLKFFHQLRNFKGFQIVSEIFFRVVSRNDYC